MSKPSSWSRVWPLSFPPPGSCCLLIYTTVPPGAVVREAQLGSRYAAACASDVWERLWGGGWVGRLLL